MPNYYSDRLSANKLRRCYELAPSRIQQLLEAEIQFVLSNINPNDRILDLGCGYGRVSQRLTEKSNQVVGIDISEESIHLANEIFLGNETLSFHIMDAKNLTFLNQSFDITICIQNGISAFRLNPIRLMEEAIRVTKRGGKLLFSSYSEKIWEERLEWFRIQAEHNLIDEIDEEITHNGVIVCKDGFRAITYSGKVLLALSARFNVDSEIVEVDDSMVFCKMTKK